MRFLPGHALPRLMGAALLIVSLTALWYWLPLREWSASTNDWVAAHGATGVLVFAAVYVIATVALVPQAILCVIAGFMFGYWGVAIALAAATAGGTAAFLIARHGLRGELSAWLSGHARMAAFDRAIGADGWKWVALLRLAPVVPINAQNYLFGVTPVRLWQFVIATPLGMAPGVAIAVSIGRAGNAAANSGPLHWTVIGIGIAAGVGAIYLLAKRARAVLESRKGRE